MSAVNDMKKFALHVHTSSHHELLYSHLYASASGVYNHHSEILEALQSKITNPGALALLEQVPPKPPI